MFTQQISTYNQKVRMGNRSAHSPHLKSIQKTIVLEQNTRKTLDLNQLVTFPHGFDGLHIWEAGIVLARFVAFNKGLFEDKEILELGSGVGIGGLAALKFTECKTCVLSDYNTEILENIKLNCQKNGYKKTPVMRLDWTEYNQFSREFDVIIGSDIVYFGCPVKALYNLIKKALRKFGKAYIIIPDRKNYADLFVKEVEQTIFEAEKVRLSEKEYLQSPLFNKEQGLKEYNLLVDVDFYVYILTKK